MKPYTLRGSALSFDPLSEVSDFVFDPENPSDIGITVDPRRNAFVALCRRFGAGGDETFLRNALAPGRDYEYSAGRLTVKKEYFLSLPVGQYVVLSAVFSKGQACLFSVYLLAPGKIGDYKLIDFDGITDDALQCGYKNEYFKSIAPEKTVTRGGRDSVRLEYDLDLFPRSVTPYFEIRRPDFIHCPRPKAISMWLCGDGSCNRVEMRFMNRAQAPVYTENRIYIDWVGWKKIFFRLPDDVQFPLLWREILRFSSDERSLSKRGVLYIDEIAAVTDGEIPDMGSPWTQDARDVGVLSIEFDGITKGRETEIRLVPLKGYAPAAPVRLRCTAALGADGEKLGFADPGLVFENGVIRTRAFTDPAFPGVTAFALSAEDAAGETSAAVWLVSSPKSEFFSSAPTNIVRNVTADPLRALAFSFATDIDTPSLPLRIHRKGRPGQEMTIPSVSVPAREADRNIVLRDTPILLDREYLAHRVAVDGLEPGTEYLCRIGDGQEFAVRTFSLEERSFDAMLISDAHGVGFKSFARLLNNTLRRAGPQTIMVSLGDMINSAADLKGFAGVVGTSEKLFRSLPFAPTPGNHERDIYRYYANYQSHFNLPDCGLAGYKNLLYSFDLYDYHFASICADGATVGSEALEWLEKDLAASDRKWKIVICHAPPYGGKGSYSFNREHLVPIFERTGVDMCISGHEHIYVRASVLGEKKAEIGEGVTYFTIGPCGGNWYTSCKNFWQDFVYGDNYAERMINGVPDQTSAVAHFTPDRIIVDVQTASRRVVDYVVLEKYEQ